VVGVILPVSVAGTAAGWELVDYRQVQLTATAGDDGRAVVEVPPLSQDELWLVDHAVVACSSTAPTSVRWYQDTETPARLLDGSDAGNFDVADWPAGLQLVPGAALLVVWSGATAGAAAAVTMQARVLRRS
jgi:hypothetical protein